MGRKIKGGRKGWTTGGELNPTKGERVEGGTQRRNGNTKRKWVSCASILQNFSRAPGKGNSDLLKG